MPSRFNWYTIPDKPGLVAFVGGHRVTVVPDGTLFVATVDGEIVGTYALQREAKVAAVRKANGHEVALNFGRVTR